MLSKLYAKALLFLYSNGIGTILPIFLPRFGNVQWLIQYQIRECRGDSAEPLVKRFEGYQRRRRRSSAEPGYGGRHPGPRHGSPGIRSMRTSWTVFIARTGS
jgi:hypothetical protein